MQSRGNGVNRGTKSQFPVSTRFIRGQDSIVGSVLYLGKKAPTGRLKRNIFMEHDDIGRISEYEELTKIVVYLDNELSGIVVSDDDVSEEYGIVDSSDDVSYVSAM